MKLHYNHTRYACYLGYITQAIVNNLAPLLFVTFQDQFSVSLEKIGLLISFNFGIQMIVDILAAKFVDKIGYRICTVAAHICCTAGLIGMGVFPFLFADPFIGLLTAVFINALGGGMIEVVISPIVESLPGDEKASAISLLHSFYCWGHVGVVILSTLFFVTAGVSNWYILTAVWALLPLFNTFFFAKVPLNTSHMEEAPMPLRKLFSMKLFWIFLLLMICSGASEQAMSQWASLFAERGLGVSKLLGDLLGPCAFAVLMGASRVFYGKFGARINLKHFIMCSAVLCILSYLLATLSPWPLLSLAGCALCGLSVGIMWPGSFSLSCEYCPQAGTAMFALLALGGDIGCAAGPGLVGAVSNAAGDSLKIGLLFAIIFPVLMFLTVMGLKRMKRSAAWIEGGLQNET